MSNVDLINSFIEHRNEEQASQMSAYMKNSFPFLGIPKPQRAVLQKGFLKDAKKKGFIDWNLIYTLWDMPEREFQYLAFDYLQELKKYLQKDDIEKIKTLIIQKSWWDTVDSLASNTIGALCLTHPELIESHILKWAKSDNLWLVRTALLFQLKYKDKTDRELLGKIIYQNSNTKEFFINKAIGWALREYSKTNKDWVKEFIDHHTLHPLSIREGSKYL